MIGTIPPMRSTNSRNYPEGLTNNTCHHNQLVGGLKSMVIVENSSSNFVKVDPKNSFQMQRRNHGLGNLYQNSKSRSNDVKFGTNRKKVTQSLDLSGNPTAVQRHHQNVEQNFRNSARMKRGVDESKTHRDITRWSHDQNNYPYHANQRSQFSFELNEFDEEICKRTATRAYATQISLECDMEVAQCVHVTAIAHDRALFEHAQCVQSHLANAKQFAITEWLKTKSKEEQTQYLSHHNQQNIPSTGKI